MIKDNDQRKQLGFLSYAFLGKPFSSPLSVGDHKERDKICQEAFLSHAIMLPTLMS